MTDTEMRELDAWIHRHIFEADLFVGLKKRGLWYCPMALGYTNKQSEAGRYTRSEAMKHECPHGEPVAVCEFEPEKYCTDPAASFELLKKLAKTNDVLVSFDEQTGDFFVSKLQAYGTQDFTTGANTLELAIAKFARKLYSK
jgi:hypothetical protein